ncbi:sensor histidine kinase [Rhizomonospora bruguierae]|uniref:sensor histidine kinase n=1 Tax=Rhizomonospora bruguierae TaxID=1581705 RepID=UPI001BCC80DF|nr:HAMP domain-containing sensor histidine kinase [Micromonospora sp. NBRC 107566]
MRSAAARWGSTADLGSTGTLLSPRFRRSGWGAYPGSGGAALELGHRPRRLSALLAVAAGAAIAAAGLLVLGAWWQKHQAAADAARPPAPGPAGTLALTLGGTALYLLAPGDPGRYRRLAGQAAALAALVTAVAGVLAGGDTRNLGRSLAVLLATGAVAALAGPAGRLGHLSGALGSAAATVALVAFAGFAFGAADPHRRAPLLLMPLPTAAGALVLAVGATLARTERGSASAFTGGGPGTAMARRLAPALLLLPFAAAGLSAAGTRTGLLDPATAIAAGTVLAALALAGVFGAAVRRLNAEGAHQEALLARVRAERDLARSHRCAKEGQAARADAPERAGPLTSDLMVHVSHQMSQPLSSSASLAELLVSDWAELPDGARRELATKIDRNTRRLAAMMRDLTLLFRLAAGKVTTRPAPVPVAEVAQSVIDALPEPVTPVHNGVAGDLYALVDRDHLAQILRNLLANAVRHGEPPVGVEAREDRAGVVITVRDHGAGIPPERLAGLFDRFAHGGGLGLHIARHLAEANGGTVGYEPGEPRGACVRVRLPRRPA